MENYTISAYEWEAWEDTENVAVWHHLNEDMRFRVTLELDKKHAIVKLLGESFTYAGDSCFYYDVIAGYARPCSTELFLVDYSPIAFDDDYGQCERLADVFRCDENGEITITGILELPAHFIEDMDRFAEQDNRYSGLAYEFHEYAEAHGLDCSTYETMRANINAYLAHVEGEQSYGFGNVNPDDADGMEHFIAEYERFGCYSPYSRAA